MGVIEIHNDVLSIVIGVIEIHNDVLSIVILMTQAWVALLARLSPSATSHTNYHLSPTVVASTQPLYSGRGTCKLGARRPRPISTLLPPRTKTFQPESFHLALNFLLTFYYLHFGAIIT